MNESKRILQQGIISLIRSAIKDEPVTIPEGFDWDEAMRIVRSHGIAAIVHYGVSFSKIQLPKHILNLLRNELYQALVIDECQTTEISKLFNEFSVYNIDYMPLKGILLKGLYRNSEMRTMGDADILIRVSQYSAISKIMQYLGYTVILESDHEFKWSKPPCVVVELHKRLISSENKDYYAYFGDGWRLAHHSTNGDLRFEMRAEDELIFLLIHFVKHYRNGGIGIKHLVDFQVFIDKHPNLDQVYICNELNKLDLYQFYQNISKTLQVWFYDQTPSKMSDYITERIFLSGAFGSYDFRLLASALKGLNAGETVAKHNRRTLFRNIFLPLELMKKKYSILRKLPALLPILWIWRILTILVLHRDKVKRLHKNYEYVNDKNVEQYRNDLSYVGLGFCVNEKNKDIV